MIKPPTFDEIFAVMAAASIADETARVQVPEDVDPDDLPNRFSIALNVLLDDLAYRAASARKEVEEKLKAEAALRESELKNRRLESEQKFSNLLESFPDAMVTITPAGTVVLVNAEAERQFGYSRAELIGKPYELLIAERYRPALAKTRAVFFAEMKRRPMDPSRDLCGLRKDGTEFPIEVSANPFQTADGLWGCCTFRDITERKATESALLLANRELEAFSYSVAHDLRTPLRGMNGFAQVLLDDYGKQLDADGREYLDSILQSSVRMAALIDALLQLSRVTRAELKREWASLSTIAEAVAAEHGRANTRRGVKFMAEANLNGSVDRVLFRTLMDNLLANAWKFTAKTRLPTVSFGSVEKLGTTTYFVRDNGAGFDMAFAKKLFVPFQRLHAPDEYPGTGIGLATVQRIVQRHGGKCWAEGAPNGGATFYFTLPGAPPLENGDAE